MITSDTRKGNVAWAWGYAYVMSNIRTIVTVAVPAVTALLGLIWYLGRKKPIQKRPPDKKQIIANKSDKDTAEAAINGSIFMQTEKINKNGQSDAETTEQRIPAAKTVASPLPMAGSGDAGENVIERVVEAKVVPCMAPAVDCAPVSAAKKLSSEVVNCQIDDSEISELANVPVNDVIVPSAVSTLQSAELSSPIRVTTETPLSHNNSMPLETEKATGAQVDNSSDYGSENLIASHSLNTELLKEQTSEITTVSPTSDDIKTQGNAVESSTSNIETDLEAEMDASPSMSRSWHEDIPDEICESCDLHSNSISTVASDTTASNIAQCTSEQTSKNDVVNNVNEQTERESTSPANSKSSKESDGESKKLENDRHSDSSNNCDNLSEVSNDSGTGGSVHGNISPPDTDRLFEFNIPVNMCGLFIGRGGSTIRSIIEQSKTKIQLQPNLFNPKVKICVIEGSGSGIEKACSIIRRKFPTIKFPGPELSSTPPTNPVIMPEIMQLNLPGGVTIDVIVSSIVDAGRIFVQQPTHPTFPSLDRLNTFMNSCYMQEGMIPDLPRPIETGVICAAPMLNGWYRAQVMSTYETQDECDIKYVDYGEAFYSPEAAVVLEELTQGKLLQAQVVGRAEDGVPYLSLA
ncbi:AKAP1-like protein [Mya arenaria]|uniref:AKAP1-like protein n=1 Tax=Mya arenaria TaxID=6604 RepID=A0ABY7E1Z8_MYAAR|nr:AKAP1-like protein [Mya arenaria]